MADDELLVCVRVSERKSSLVKGSKKRICELCEQEVWVAPSGLKRVRKGATIICMNCARRAVKKSDGEIDVAHITDEQWDEIDESTKYRLN